MDWKNRWELGAFYLAAIRRYPVSFWITAAAVMLLGWALVWLRPSLYLASMQLRIADTELWSELVGVAQPQERSGVGDIQAAWLLSRSDWLRLLPETAQGQALTDDLSGARALRDLQQRFKVYLSEPHQTLRVTYCGDSPQASRELLQRWIHALKQRLFEKRLRRARAQHAFWQAEREATEQTLQSKRARLWPLSMRLGESDIDVRIGVREALYARSDDLSQARLALQEAQGRLTALEQQRAQYRTATLVDRQEVQDEIELIESRISSLLLSYTEQHPDVKALRTRLALLKHAVQAGQARDTVLPGRLEESDEELGGLELQVASAAAEVEGLQRRVDGMQQNAGQLAHRIASKPSMEWQQRRLQHELGVLETDFATLLEKEHSAARELRAVMQVKEQFNVLHAPESSALPEGFSKMFAVAAVGGLGLIMGAIAVSLRYWWAFVRSAQGLSGSNSCVSPNLTSSPPTRTRRMLLALGWSVLALIGLALLVHFHTHP